MDILNTEHVYQKYLQNSGLKEEEMQPTQRKMMRITFFAGMFMMLNDIQGFIADLPDDEAVKALDDVNEQIKSVIRLNHIRGITDLAKARGQISEDMKESVLRAANMEVAYEKRLEIQGVRKHPCEHLETCTLIKDSKCVPACSLYYPDVKTILKQMEG